MGPMILTNTNDENNLSLLSLNLNITLEDCNPLIMILHGVCASVMAYCCILLCIFVFSLYAITWRSFGCEDIFTLTIVIGNFLVAFFHSTTIPISAFYGKWVFGDALCGLTGTIYFVGFDMRYSSLIALALQRFLHFLYPLKYPKRSKCTITFLIVLITMYILISHIWYIWNSIIFFDISWPTCDSQSHPDLIDTKMTKARVIIWCAYHLFGMAPFIFYSIMWTKALRLTKMMNSQNRFVSERASEESLRQKHIAVKKKIRKQMKGLRILVMMLTTGIPTVLIVYFKSGTGGRSFGFDHPCHTLILQFVLTQVTLINPYLDIATLLYTSKQKKNMTKKLLKKIKMIIFNIAIKLICH